MPNTGFINTGDMYANTFNTNQQRQNSAVRIQSYIDQWGRTAYRYVDSSGNTVSAPGGSSGFVSVPNTYQPTPGGTGNGGATVTFPNGNGSGSGGGGGSPLLGAVGAGILGAGQAFAGDQLTDLARRMLGIAGGSTNNPPTKAPSQSGNPQTTVTDGRPSTTTQNLQNQNPSQQFIDQYLTPAGVPFYPHTPNPNAQVDPYQEVDANGQPTEPADFGGGRTPPIASPANIAAGAFGGALNAVPPVPSPIPSVDVIMPDANGFLPNANVPQVSGNPGADTISDAAGLASGGGSSSAAIPGFFEDPVGNIEGRIDSFFSQLSTNPVETLTGIGVNIAAGIMGTNIGTAFGGDQAGAGPGGTIGGIIGTAVIPIPVVGTILGSAIGSFIGSFVGAHPTTGPISSSTIVFRPEDGSFYRDTRADPGIRTPENEQTIGQQIQGIADGFGAAVQGSIQSILQDTGGHMTSMPNISVGTKWQPQQRRQMYYGTTMDEMMTGNQPLFWDPGIALANATLTALERGGIEGADQAKLDGYIQQLRDIVNPRQQAGTIDVNGVQVDLSNVPNLMGRSDGFLS